MGIENYSLIASSYPVKFELFGTFLSNYLALLGADDEGLAGGVDDVRCDGVELVDVQDAGDLGHESFDESEVSAGDPGDGAGGLGVVRGGGVER